MSKANEFPSLKECLEGKQKMNPHFTEKLYSYYMVK